MNERGAAALRVRRANAPVVSDDGNCAGLVSRLLYLDPGSAPGWLREFRRTGPSLVDPADCPQREGKLTQGQESAPRALLRNSPPRDTDEVRAAALGPAAPNTAEGHHQAHAQAGVRIREAAAAPRRADEMGRQGSVRKHQRLMRDMHTDETLVFAVAVHPEYQTGFAQGLVALAIRTAASRRRPDLQNLHAALDLERMKVSMAVSGASTPEPP